MLSCNPGGHAAYQDTFVSDFLKFYPDSFVFPKSTRNYIVQFFHLDLSLADFIMQEYYSVFGPQPRLPSYMLRSYLLALKLKIASLKSNLPKGKGKEIKLPATLPVWLPNCFLC